MSTSPQRFGTRLIGQTENALGAILDRQLAGTGLTEHRAGRRPPAGAERARALPAPRLTGRGANGELGAWG